MLIWRSVAAARLARISSVPAQQTVCTHSCLSLYNRPEGEQ